MHNCGDDKFRSLSFSICATAGIFRLVLGSLSCILDASHSLPLVLIRILAITRCETTIYSLQFLMFILVVFWRSFTIIIIGHHTSECKRVSSFTGFYIRQIDMQMCVVTRIITGALATNGCISCEFKEKKNRPILYPKSISSGSIVFSLPNKFVHEIVLRCRSRLLFNRHTVHSP